MRAKDPTDRETDPRGGSGILPGWDTDSRAPPAPVRHCGLRGRVSEPRMGGVRLLSFVLLSLVLAASCVLLGGGERRPNLVLLLADDAGFADFGFQEQPDALFADRTPAIDSIARAGARFTDFTMAGAVCSPSRAALLTGRYPQRFGHERNLPVGHDGGLDLGETTLAERLRAAGYRTACIGKWHLGYPDAYHPNRRGFDHFHGLLQGSRSYHPIEEPTRWRVLQENGRRLPEGGYVTDRLGDAAVAFVRENADRPFFLFLSFTAPHGPLQPAKRHWSELASLGIDDRKRRAYLGLMLSLDENVGKVLDALEEEGIADRTLVVFTNDNGGQTKTGANNAPLRGRKGTLWEGGVRVPCAMRWPGRIEPDSVLRAPCSSLDLVPTFLRAAGVPLDPETFEEARRPLDGVDLAPLFAGGTLEERTLFWRTQGSGGPWAARRGRWKLVRRESGEPAALFDLWSDPGETTDVRVGNPEVADALEADVARWESTLIEPAWEY